MESQTNGWRCPSCQFPNKASDAECFVCHRPRAADPTGQKAPDAAMLEGLPSPRTHRMRLLAAIGSGALLVGLIGVLLLSSIGPQGPNGIAAATASPTQPEGQVADAPTGTPFPSDAPGTHTVQTWDTLYGIAQSLGVSEEQLRYWNYEKYPALRGAPRGIHVGWVLITDGPPLPTPTPRPSPRPPTPVPSGAPPGLVELPLLTADVADAAEVYHSISGRNPGELSASASSTTPRYAKRAVKPRGRVQAQRR